MKLRPEYQLSADEIAKLRKYTPYQSKEKKRKTHTHLDLDYPDWFNQQCAEFLAAMKCRACGCKLPRKNQTLCEKHNNHLYKLEYLGISMLRKQIHRKFNHTCQKCGVMFITEFESGFKMPRYRGHVHHIKPLSEGGADNEDNMTLLCEECHRNEHRKH